MTSNIQKDAIADECYIVEIDEKVKSEYRRFAEAVFAGMTLKQQFPQSDIKVREANERSLSVH
jgi:hypothetical protein